MRSAKKVPLQSTITHRIGRLISGCRFFLFTVQKYLQADYFGAGSRPFIAERLLAADDVCVNVQSDFPLTTTGIPIPQSGRSMMRYESQRDLSGRKRLKDISFH